MSKTAIRKSAAAVLLLISAIPVCAHTLRVKGNRIYLDGKRGQILYKSSGDLDGDGRREVVLLAWTYDERFGGIIVAKQTASS